MERILEIEEGKLDSNPIRQLTITFKKEFSLTFIIFKIEEIIPICIGHSEAKYKMKSFIHLTSTC